MMGYISRRSRITRIKNITDYVCLILAGNKEYKFPCRKQKTARHGDTLLPVIGIDTHLIGMKGSKQVFLTGKNGRRMAVISRTKQYGIKSRKATPVPNNVLLQPPADNPRR